MNTTDEIRVGDLYALLWRKKWILIATTFLLTLGALVSALVLPKQYLATTTVAVSPESMEGGVGGSRSVVSSFGGLASLIGLSSQTASPEAVDVATLQSLILTEKFVDNNRLSPILFSKYWNATSRRWTGKYKIHGPTTWDAAQLFRKKVISVVVHAKTGLIDVSASWTDPRLAAQWANDMVIMTNDYLRNQSIAEIQREITYLESQATQTSDVTVKVGIYSLIQHEIGRMTVVQGHNQYAFTVIDPAFVPEQPYSPRPVLWALAGMLTGLILSLGAIIVRAGWVPREMSRGGSPACATVRVHSAASGPIPGE